MLVKRAGLVLLVLLPLLALGGLCGGIDDVRAQQPPAPAAPAPAGSPVLNVLVVDVQSLLQNSKAAKNAREQIEPKGREYQGKLDELNAYVESKRQALGKLQESLSAEALNQRRKEYVKDVNQRQEALKQEGDALRRSSSEANQKISDAMLKIITEIAKERKANLVFQLTELVLFDPSFDVTNEVLQKLDEQLPTLTVNFAAPAPAPAAGGAPPAHPAATPPKKKK